MDGAGIEAELVTNRCERHATFIEQSCLLNSLGTDAYLSNLDTEADQVLADRGPMDMELARQFVHLGAGFIGTLHSSEFVWTQFPSTFVEARDVGRSGLSAI